MERWEHGVCHRTQPFQRFPLYYPMLQEYLRTVRTFLSDFSAIYLEDNSTSHTLLWSFLLQWIAVCYIHVCQLVLDNERHLWQQS